MSSSFWLCFQILNNSFSPHPYPYLYSTTTFQNAWACLWYNQTSLATSNNFLFKPQQSSLPSHLLLTPSANSSFTWDSQHPQFQFLSEFYFPAGLLFEHHIHQKKIWCRQKMLSHLSTSDFFDIFDTTSVLVIFKNVIDHCLSFTLSKC